MAYGFSVFWLPLARAIGIRQPVTCEGAGFLDLVTSTRCDWPVSMLGWTYTLFFVFLGSSAALFGHWLERAGPRKAGAVAAVCWCGGLFVSAFGVYVHQVWLIWLGSGVIGGIGLGLGYISPVSTLIRWFPDRRGMATGLAIMGFGGGAMIGAPLADRLMNAFAGPTTVGVWQTFAVLGGIYLVSMLLGAFGYRLPPPGWQPAGFAPNAGNRRLMTSRHVHVNEAIRTPQFWLLWGVLCLNVSAGIGVIGMASPMLQEVFGGRLLGMPTPLAALADDQRAAVATLAAAFAGLLSLFNIAGRIFWASLSDRIGRRITYSVFFLLGIRPHRSQDHVLGVLPAGDRVVRQCAARGWRRANRCIRRHLLRHPHHVRRRLRDRAGLPRGSVRHAACRSDTRTTADRLVSCRHRRTGRSQLHPGIPARPWSPARAGLQHDDVRPRRDAPRGLRLQPDDPARA
jgi:MFS family permease